MTKEIFHTYSHVSDFIEFVNSPLKTSGWERRRGSQEESGRRDGWAGTRNFKEACDLATNGWPEGLKDITSKIGIVKNDGKGKSRIHDVAGDLPNVGRFLANMPDCMSRRVINNASKRPCLDVVVNASYSSVVRPQNIMNYGAAIAVIIDELENAGYSLSLSAASTTNNCAATNQGFMINLKNHGEGLDLDKLVFFIAHPSFLRRLAFAEWEHYANCDQLGDGYGQVSDVPKQHRKGAIYFAGKSQLSGCATVEGAYAYVQELIRATHPELLGCDGQESEAA